MKLLENPPKATQDMYPVYYNYIFLNGGWIGDIACGKISLVNPPRFVVQFQKTDTIFSSLGVGMSSMAFLIGIKP